MVEIGVNKTNSIARWIILISGFTQSIERATGFEKLWLKCRTYVGARTALQLKEWDDDFNALAAMIWRLRPEDQKLELYVFAYSWGCGHGFITFAKALRKQGIKIKIVVFCDPIYHKWYAPWRAIFSPIVEPKIHIPDNVIRVRQLCQNQNKPSCHKVVALDKSTTQIEDPVMVRMNHEYMDDSDEFHSMCLEVLDEANLQ